MVRLSDIVHELPAMKSGDILKKELAVLPDYDDSICNEDVATREF